MPFTKAATRSVVAFSCASLHSVSAPCGASARVEGAGEQLGHAEQVEHTGALAQEGDAAKDAHAGHAVQDERARSEATRDVSHGGRTSPRFSDLAAARCPPLAPRSSISSELDFSVIPQRSDKSTKTAHHSTSRPVTRRESAMVIEHLRAKLVSGRNLVSFVD